MYFVKNLSLVGSIERQLALCVHVWLCSVVCTYFCVVRSCFRWHQRFVGMRFRLGESREWMRVIASRPFG